jgi:hypothetical protein
MGYGQPALMAYAIILAFNGHFNLPKSTYFQSMLD